MQKIKYDFWFTVALIALIGQGVIYVFSSSSVFGHTNFDNMYYFAVRHLIFDAIGIAAAYFIARVPYQKYAKHIPLLNIAGAGLLLFVAIAGTASNGAERWISLGPISFQPSEVAKVIVIVTLSYYIAKFAGEGKLNSLKKGVAPLVCYILAVALLIAPEKHASAIGVILLISFTLLLIGGVDKKYFIALLPVGVVGAVGLIATQSYRMNRILGFLDPEKDADGKGYHVMQSFYALGSGNWFGLGLGESREKFSWLPYNHTDFIMSVVGEEKGFVFGTMVVIALFAVLVFRGLWIAWHAPDRFGMLLAAGVTMLIFFQACINMAVASGLFPVTGMPLPFISYGGSSTVILLASVGLIFNVASQTEIKD